MDTTPPNHTTMERLRRLRAQAESLLSQDPTSPEGLTFQERYLTLLAKYAIDEATLTTDTPEQSVVSVRYAYPALTWAEKRSQLIHHVCRIFELPHHTIQITGADRWEMLICGHRATTEVAIAITEHLLPQLDRFIVFVHASDEYQQLHNHARPQYASDAIDSWIARVVDRLTLLYVTTKDQQPNAQANALVLADQFTAANHLLEQRLQDIQNTVNLTAQPLPPALRYRSEAAHRTGTAAADSADLGQTRMEDHHRPALGTE